MSKRKPSPGAPSPLAKLEAVGALLLAIPPGVRPHGGVTSTVDENGTRVWELTVAVGTQRLMRCTIKWREEGTVSEFKTWKEARDHAEKEAARIGVAHGIEKPTPFQGWTVKMLPLPKNRQGWELRCEAVEPEDARAFLGRGKP